MRSAEGGEEVVKSVFIQDVDASQSQGPFVFFAIEEVVLPDGGVEEVARCNALRVFVVVSGIRSGDVDQAGSELGRRADAGKRGEWSDLDAVADETRLKLLIGGERLAECADHLDGRLPIQRSGGDKARAIGICNPAAGGVAGDQAAVVPGAYDQPHG